MIDYYTGKDLETGEELNYLKPVSQKIKSSDSSERIYMVLSRMSDLLMDMENRNQLNADYKRLLGKIEGIKRTFLDETSKRHYDQQLHQFYKEQEEKRQPQKIVTDLTSQKRISEDYSAQRDQMVRQIATPQIEKAAQSKSIKWQKVFLQLVIAVILLTMAIFLKFSLSLILVVCLVILVLGIFLIQ